MLFALLLYFIGLPLLDLNGSDEPREAGIGVEMAVNGNFIVPSLNGQPFLEKPPLFYWLQTCSYHTFGFTTMAARLPSVLSALGGIAIVFWLAAAMGFSPLAAFLSGLILALAPQYWSNGRTCMLDITLTAMIAAAIYTFFRCVRADSWPDRIAWMLLYAAAAGAALMTKGLVGMAIPGIALAGWLFLWIVLRRRLTARHWIMLAIGSFLAFIPIAIWFYMIYTDLGKQGLYTAAWTNNFGRFTGGYAEHVEPFYYYFTKLEVFQPWLCLLPFAIYWHLRRIKTGRGGAHLLLLCWGILPMFLLMASSGKRIVYLLPENPAWALLAGTFLAAVLEGKVIQARRLQPLRLLSWAAAALGPLLFIASIGMLVMGKVLHLPLKSILPLALISLALAALMIYFERRKCYEHFFITMLLQIVMVFGLVSFIAASYNNRKNSARPLFSAVAWKLGEGKELILYRPMERMEGSAVFYLQRTFRRCGKPEELAKLLNGKYSSHYIVIARAEDNIPNTHVISTSKIKKDVYVLLEPDKKP